MSGLKRLVDQFGGELWLDRQNLVDLGASPVDIAVASQACGEKQPGEQISAPDRDCIPGMADGLVVVGEEVMGGAGDRVERPGPDADGVELEGGFEVSEGGLRVARVDGFVADREMGQRRARVGLQRDSRLVSRSVVFAAEQVRQRQDLVSGPGVGVDLYGAPCPLDGLVELGIFVLDRVRPAPEEVGETQVGVCLRQPPRSS